MIVIKRSSFLYALASSGGKTVEPKNLCEFFWKTLFNITWLLFVAVLLGVSVGYLLGSYAFILMFRTSDTIVVTGVMCLIYYGVWRAFTLKVDVEKTKPNLIREYLKAYKERHCPLISYEE